MRDCNKCGRPLVDAEQWNEIENHMGDCGCARCTSVCLSNRAAFDCNSTRPPPKSPKPAPPPDPRDAEIAALRAEIADAKNALDNTFREIDRLRDRARRLKGWRVDHEYFGYPGHGREREWMDWKGGRIMLHNEARGYARSYRKDPHCRNVRIVRVYRRARPA